MLWKFLNTVNMFSEEEEWPLFVGIQVRLFKQGNAPITVNPHQSPTPGKHGSLAPLARVKPKEDIAPHTGGIFSGQSPAKWGQCPICRDRFQKCEWNINFYPKLSCRNIVFIRSVVEFTLPLRLAPSVAPRVITLLDSWYSTRTLAKQIGQQSLM